MMQQSYNPLANYIFHQGTNDGRKRGTDDADAGGKIRWRAQEYLATRGAKRLTQGRTAKHVYGRRVAHDTEVSGRLENKLATKTQAEQTGPQNPLTFRGI